jgi:hypothetical protein
VTGAAGRPGSALGDPSSFEKVIFFQKTVFDGRG